MHKKLNTLLTDRLRGELSDRHWKRAQSVFDDVHKSSNFKTETLSGDSSPAICWAIIC